MKDVYVRMFAKHMPSGEAPFHFGNPPLEVCRARICGTVVKIEADRLFLDDATAIAVVLWDQNALNPGKTLQLGAVVDAWGDLCEHRVLNGHTVVDRSEDACAEVAAMLETTQLYKTYFRNSFPVLPDVNSKVVHVPLSPIAKRPKVEPPPNMDDSLLASKVGAVLSPTQGQSLASVATRCDIGSEKDVLAVLQSMIWAGLCYEKGSLFFAL